MTLSRRSVLRTALTVPLYAAAARALPETTSAALPDKAGFPIDGVYLNAAFAHPLGRRPYDAIQAWLGDRMHHPKKSGPANNPRDSAVAAFAGLINADPTEVAVVPSTMEGENLVGTALGLGPKAGVVTDAYHYGATLAMYGELERGGVPVRVVAPRDHRIDLRDLDAAIGTDTRLVAVSLVSSLTGYPHDLKALCEVAHAKGALVHADIIQAAGAIPIDVKASGVDFCCCGTYKWLMGDFGVAFLYVRPDRLAQLRHPQYGWRQFRGETHHTLPYDTPGPAIGDWKLGTDTASHFEVSTPSWAALAGAAASITYLRELGVPTIERYRQPLIDRLQTELPKLGFEPLTPQDRVSPIASFACPGAAARFAPTLEQAAIKISLYPNLIRISPSIYNDMDDIDRLLAALRRAPGRAATS